MKLSLRLAIDEVDEIALNHTPRYDSPPRRAGLSTTRSEKKTFFTFLGLHLYLSAHDEAYPSSRPCSLIPPQKKKVFLILDGGN
jgi:hypothetical protein